jgi:twitching motility protein PilT
MQIIDLLTNTKRNNASDLHLTPDMPACIRLNGEITPMAGQVLSADDIKGMVYSILTDSQRATFEKDLEIDFAIQFGEEMRFRVNAFNSLKGVCAVFRTIPTEIYSMEQLSMPDVFKKICKLTKGLVLVTGPTGSGKSTTLAAMIHEINMNKQEHILTIEDPVEFVHKPIKSIVNQRELHVNTHSFSNALKSALREDPDIILVGEMRDLETISLALTAAETGHLVFGTLHTSSATKTIDRIIDVFPGSEKELIRSMLSSSIQAVISQSLIKTADGNGRVAAHEIMLGTPAVRNLIRENKIPQLDSLIQVGSKYGMVSLKDSVSNLVRKNKISKESAELVLNMAGGSDFDEKVTTSGGQAENNESDNDRKTVFENHSSVETPIQNKTTPNNSDF